MLAPKKRVVGFWALVVVAAGLELAIHKIHILDDYFDLTMFLPLLALWPAIMILKRLTTDFRSPRWIRIYGWCVWAVVILGVPLLALSRGPESFPPAFLACVGPAIAVYLFGVTVHVWKQA